MMTDVTDATFEAEVLQRSESVPVVVDLWAPWCGPCRTLGPVLEKVVGATGGTVELVKVNVDENPRVSSTFGVQSIPAVFALRSRQVVDSFIGALPEAAVAEFVAKLVPQADEALTGDEAPRADEVATVADDGLEARLDALLEIVKDDEEARRQFLELLEAMGPEDPRTNAYRRALTSRLF